MITNDMWTIKNACRVPNFISIIFDIAHNSGHFVDNFDNVAKCQIFYENTDQNKQHRFHNLLYSSNK